MFDDRREKKIQSQPIVSMRKCELNQNAREVKNYSNRKKNGVQKPK